MHLADSPVALPSDSRTVVLLGAGAIGSHLAPHVGRMDGIARAVIVDPDVYEPGNVAGQDILPEHVGQPKAWVQAERLRRINPSLEVHAIQSRLEDAPVGCLRGILLGGLDSRQARQRANERAWWLGAPLIDGGASTGRG